MDPSSGTGSVPLEALLSQAAALGLQPQQILQIPGILQHLQQQQQQVQLQQQQQQQQQQHAAGATASTTQNMILQGIPSNLHAVLSQQQNQSGQNPALILAAQQQALANQQAAVLAAAQQQQQVQAQQKQRAEQQQPMLTSLAWPEHNPAVQIPHFDAETYKRVNIDINYSAIPSGMDLPINNVDTLRFFFNFGVSQAKTILERLARGPTNQALPPNLSNSALLK